MSSPRALIYVQHLLGTGHLVRAARIARAMVAGGFDVTFVTGGMPVAGLDVPGALIVQLPPIRTADDTFSQLVDGEGRVVDDAFKGRRRELLLAAFATARPAVVVTEMYPFGRRQMRFEIEPLLERAIATTPRPVIAASVRDILVPRRPERVDEMVARVERFFDLVLVHGDPRFIPLGETFPRAADIEGRLRYTGYVVDVATRPTSHTLDAEAEVLVSAGGGAVGARLLQAALAARPLSRLATAPWRLLTGANLTDAAFARLQAAATDGVVVERARADFAQRLATCRASISQGGYNTIVEVLMAGVAAVVVPYESEQALRCRLLAARGFVQSVAETALTPAALADALGRAIATPRPQLDIAVDGAARTASLLRETTK